MWPRSLLLLVGLTLIVQARQNVLAVIEAARRLPGVRGDRVGLVGWSAGAALAVSVASSDANVQAVVAVAGFYSTAVSPNDPAPMSLVQNLGAPLLILHGTNDQRRPVRDARAYETRARELGKNVQAYYYEGADHFLLLDRRTKEDVLRRSVEFFNQYLRRSPP